jgi:hypothetical protein
MLVLSDKLILVRRLYCQSSGRLCLIQTLAFNLKLFINQLLCYLLVFPLRFLDQSVYKGMGNISQVKTSKRIAPFRCGIFGGKNSLSFIKMILAVFYAQP